MRFWKKLRSRIANMLSANEWGGVLFNYKNGELEELHRWESTEDLNSAWELVQNMSFAGRDAIYLAMIKCGHKMGYFIVHDSNLGWHEFYFDPKHYDFHDAYREAVGKCREIADGMGFRNPKEPHAS